MSDPTEKPDTIEQQVADGRHQCEPDDSWPEYDARGIYLCRVCEVCEKAKLRGYRPDVLTDPQYWHDEPLDEDY